MNNIELKSIKIPVRVFIPVVLYRSEDGRLEPHVYSLAEGLARAGESNLKDMECMYVKDPLTMLTFADMCFHADYGEPEFRKANTIVVKHMNALVVQKAVRVALGHEEADDANAFLRHVAANEDATTHIASSLKRVSSIVKRIAQTHNNLCKSNGATVKTLEAIEKALTELREPCVREMVAVAEDIAIYDDIEQMLKIKSA